MSAGYYVLVSIHLLAAALLQLTLGISTLLLRVPVSLGVAHQGGGALLLVALVLAWHADVIPRERSEPVIHGERSEPVIPSERSDSRDLHLSAHAR